MTNDPNDQKNMNDPNDPNGPNGPNHPNDPMTGWQKASQKIDRMVYLIYEII